MENPVVIGDMRLTLIGKKCALIENYKGILSYDENHVIVQSKKEQLILQGKKLQILYYTQEEMEVLGMIESVEVKDCSC